MSDNRVITEKRGHLWLMGLNRPEKLNAFDPRMLDELRVTEIAEAVAQQAPLGVQETLANARVAAAEAERAATTHLVSILPRILESEDAAEGLSRASRSVGLGGSQETPRGRTQIGTSPFPDCLGNHSRKEGIRPGRPAPVSAGAGSRR